MLRKFSRSLITLAVLTGFFLAFFACQPVLTPNQSDAVLTGQDRNVAAGQNGMIYQYFHWYTAGGGTLWNTIKNDALNLENKGVTAVWFPPAYKGQAGASDVGYGVYDMYDLGEFSQKGTVATKYGTKLQYTDAIAALHARGIQAYADIVMNHKIGADGTESLLADKMDWNNRNTALSTNQTISAWTAFNYPGRANTYSSFKWNKNHFHAVDWDQNTSTNALFRFSGKGWNWEVDNEKGNFDYLMGADVDFDNLEVDNEYKTWAKWYMTTAGIDGLRIDAVKHIKFSWFNGWLDYLRGASGVNKNFFAVGEYVSGDVNRLNNFITVNGGRMSLFDFPLHYRLQTASNSGGGYDMRTIFDGTLTQVNPTLSVSFVDNHDTQPLQALASPVADWFKPIAYALILTRQAGYPMVFWLDEFGGSYTDKGQTINLPATPKLAKIMEVRKNYAYGTQTDYFDDPNIIGWTRQGTSAFPGSGLAALVTDGAGGSKSMFVGTAFAGKTFYDYTGNVTGTVTINSSGYGTFSVPGGSIALWVPSSSTPVTPPAAPTGLTASASGSSTINLSWTASANATSYTVYRSATSGGALTSVGTATGTTFSNTGLTASTTYFYKVTASNAGGTSGNSNEASATTTAASAGLKVHFLSNSIANWTNVNLYYWASNGSPVSNTWPGAPMTSEGNGWWVGTIPGSSSSNVIFNNGTVQTVDLSQTVEAWFTPTGTSAGKIIGTWSTTAPITTPNADLSALSVSSSALSPAFAAATTAYTATAAFSVSTATVSATKVQAGGTLQYQVNGGALTTLASGGTSATFALNVGANTINVKSVANDGTTTKTYTVTLTRAAASTNADLSALSVSAGALSPAFAAATTAYTVSTTATTTTVTATKAQAGATLQYQIAGGAWTNLTSGTASASLSLVVGTNVLNVKVTAENGTTVKTYGITITRTNPTTTGKLTIIMKSNGSAQSVKFPGDANSWNINTTDLLSVAANSTASLVRDGVVTSAAIGQGSSTTALELQVINGSAGTWSNNWGFGTWTKVGCTVPDGKQITIPCTANQNVTLTIDVTTNTLTATVQ